MKIEVINQSNLKIKPAKQNIDQKLGVPPPFPDRPAVYVISGRMGSGKSSFVNSIMCSHGSNKVFCKAFDSVFYATPQEVFDSEDSHPFKDHPKERMYFELSVDMLKEVQEKAIENKKEGKTSCLILDDFSEVYKTKAIEVQLKKIIFKHRHMKLNIIITLTNLRALPKTLRSLISVYVMFKPSVIEIESFNEDVFKLRKEEMKELMDFVYDKPYNFMFYNQITDTFYKNFDELQIDK